MNFVKAGIFMFFAVAGLIPGLTEDSPGWENNSAILAVRNGTDKLNSRDSTRADNYFPIKLIQPDSASQVTSITPTFTWHPVATDAPIQYRLIIATIDGRIIFDEWIGSDTSYTMAAPNKIEDLHAYYWSVHGSAGNRPAQSPVWSLWVDQDKVTDLTVSNIVLEQEKSDWEPGDEVKIGVTVQNSGPTNAEACYVTLYSGNLNRNYFSYAAHRKTIALDTVLVSALPLNQPRSVILTAKLPKGFNHFFVRIDPAPGLREAIYSNNFTEGIRIQTEDQQLSLKSLFIIYKNYLDPEAGEKRLNESDLDTLQQNILDFQHYFWNHTYVIQIQIDTLHIDRLLTAKDFSHQDDQWGQYLSPDRVNSDLVRRYIAEEDYDLVFVYYSWWNSKASWSGYSGYTFKEARLFKQKVPFLAQPVITGQFSDETTAIHEMLHLLDNLYEQNGEKRFYSPHHRLLYTTFEKNQDFYDWILETWPADRWLDLKIGQIVPHQEAPWLLEPFKRSVEAKMSILSQNYPNPFTQMTAIIYRIPQPDSPSTSVKIKLVIYDRLGNPVRTLADHVQNPGTHRVYWDGKDQQGNTVSSGIYFYELTANHQHQIKKLLFIRP